MTPEDREALEQMYQEVVNGNGVGSQLWRLLKRLGIHNNAQCSCVLLADIMNTLGPQGCREQKETLLKLMSKNQEKYGWKDYFRAAKNAVLLGWIFKLNPLDPLPGLLNEAIKLAEQS
jgi:hypothetical protein